MYHSGVLDLLADAARNGHRKVFQALGAAAISAGGRAAAPLSAWDGNGMPASVRIRRAFFWLHQRCKSQSCGRRRTVFLVGA